MQRLLRTVDAAGYPLKQRAHRCEHQLMADFLRAFAKGENNKTGILRAANMPSYQRTRRYIQYLTDSGLVIKTDDRRGYGESWTITERGLRILARLTELLECMDLPRWDSAIPLPPKEAE